MIAWSLTFCFLAMSLPPLTASQDLAGALALDSASKERILQRQYAEGSCYPWQTWDAEDLESLGEGSVELNGYTITWDEEGCSASRIDANTRQD